MTNHRRQAIIRRLERIIHITHVALFFAAGALLLALWGLNGLAVVAAVGVLFFVATFLGRHSANAAPRVRRPRRVPAGTHR